MFLYTFILARESKNIKKKNFTSSPRRGKKRLTSRPRIRHLTYV